MQRLQLVVRTIVVTQYSSLTNSAIAMDALHWNLLEYVYMLSIADASYDICSRKRVGLNLQSYSSRPPPHCHS